MHVPQPMLQLKKLTHQLKTPIQQVLKQIQQLKSTIADGIIGNCGCSWELRAPWHPKITTKAIVAKSNSGEVAAVLDSKLEWDLFNSLHSPLASPCEVVI